MNEENTKKLFEDFPEFLKHRDNWQSSLMMFGFACGDGWFDLIYQLCKDIRQWFEKNEHRVYDDKMNCIGTAKGVPEYFYVTQVKEKFGMLCFYISPAPTAIHDLIHEAEEKSVTICEYCGAKGKYRDGLGYVQTLCDNCLDKLIEKMFRRPRQPDEDFISDWQKKNGGPFK